MPGLVGDEIYEVRVWRLVLALLNIFYELLYQLGKIKLSFLKASKKSFNIDLRIPRWATNATIHINGEPVAASTTAGSYVTLNQKWKKGDVIELNLDMTARLMEANPLVEETRNQTAVMRGPIVYCIESPDLKHTSIFNVIIPTNIELKPSTERIGGAHLTFLQGNALLQPTKDWDKELYQPINSNKELKEIKIRLVPYFAWGNRGISEMAVWMPVHR